MTTEETVVIILRLGRHQIGDTFVADIDTDIILIACWIVATRSSSRSANPVPRHLEPDKTIYPKREGGLPPNGRATTS